MNFSELLNINPILSSFIGLSVLIINYFFSYTVSTKFNLINNTKLNFVFFNTSFYFLISSILLFLILFKIEIIMIRYLVYLIFLIQVIFLFFNYKNIFKKSRGFFNKLDYFFLLILFLYTFSQVSDADSLDYHLGGVLEIIRSNNFESRIDEWYFFRLIGLGEMINLYGLFFYSLNFGQIFQVLVISNLILILGIFNKGNKINYLIILSFPIMISLMLSAKHMPLITNCYLVIFSIIILKIELLPKTFLAILILIIAPTGFKYTYLIYSLPLWFLFIIYYKNEIDIKRLILYSIVIFILIPGSFYLKNLIHYGDPITPFFEFLKVNSNKDLMFFASNIRHGAPDGKIFNFYELLIIPIIHALPSSLGGVSLLASPIILVCFFVFLKEKNKILIYFFIIVYILLFFSEKTSSRFFLDLYFLGILLFLKNLNYYRNKIYYKYIIISLLPYAMLGVFMILYSISTLSVSILNKENYKKIMNEKTNNYEIIQWINSKTTSSDIIMFDKSSSSIRSKAHQKNKIFFYKMNNKSFAELKKIIKDNNISKIVLGEGAFKNNYEQFYKCKKIDTHKLYHATRNPINSRKSIGNIYLLDVRCLI